METTIKASISRRGKTLEGTDKELVEIIAKDAILCTDVLVNLIIFITGSSREDRDSRFAARNIAASLVHDFRKSLGEAGSTQKIALTVVTAYFTNPRLIADVILKLMIKREKAI